VAVLNTLLNLRLAERASAQGAPSDDKTLVCLFLNGGNDSFNWLVPRDAGRHAVYSAARGNLALGRAGLRDLDQTPQGDGQLYGMHPSCAGLQELFNGLDGDAGKRRAAFVANVGTLIQPTTKAQYLAETVPLPRALFSHSDQIDQWQTSVPQGMSELTGWGGRAADVLHAQEFFLEQFNDYGSSHYSRATGSRRAPVCVSNCCRMMARRPMGDRLPDSHYNAQPNVCARRESGSSQKRALHAPAAAAHVSQDAQEHHPAQDLDETR
jgi:uncharacterized protein (DUF1501 family)